MSGFDHYDSIIEHPTNMIATTSPLATGARSKKYSVCNVVQVYRIKVETWLKEWKTKDIQIMIDEFSLRRNAGVFQS
eukprot:scaffold291_cov92-Cylindrotheca_fusiformis.AAC.2